MMQRTSPIAALFAWLALMIPYSLFFFAIDTLIVWRVINWFDAKVAYVDIMPVRALRDFGLGLVERMPPLKSFFIRQAAGLSGPDGPRLLRGEAI